MFRGFAALNAGSAKASRKTKHKKRGLINIARRNKTLRRKEIVYSAEEWEQIEKQAAECHLKTSTFIRAMSLNGEVKVVDLAASTALNYSYHRKRLAPFIGHIKLKDLTPIVLNKAYTDMINAGISKKYVRELHTFVHTVLGMAFKEGLIPRNYASAATPPKKIRPEVEALSEEQLSAFFKALYADEKNYFYQVFFSLLLASGCRIGELCALSWDNVDFENNRIHICKHFVLDKSGRHVEDGCKTTAGERWLYMDNSIMKMLTAYRMFWIKQAMEHGSKWNVFTRAVFVSPNKQGDYLSPNTVREWLRRFLEKNKIKRIHPHQFRHTAISLQLQAGISVPDAAKRAGHVRPDVTLSIYAHTLKNNDVHCCEAVTRVLPDMPKHKTG